MVLMKNATGNVYKNVTPNKVDDYLRKGFVIVEGGGGKTPPTPAQDVKPTLQEVLRDIEPGGTEVIEPVEIIETDNPLILSSGLYLTQITTKPKLAQAFREIGIPYDYKNESRADFIKKRDKYIKECKTQKRR